MVNVLKSGFYTTIQDLGRVGFQEYGVPYSGVMDIGAASLANALLGNDESAAVLEMTMTGATVQFDCDTLICLSGANMNPKLNNGSISNNKAVRVKKHDILSFGKLETGFRCYLSVSGGFKTQMVMGSRSMCKHITQQFLLKKGDSLPIEKEAMIRETSYVKLRIDKTYLSKSILEVYKGPEFYLLSKDQQAQLLTANFSVSKYNNRMAYQLEAFLENNINPIITAPVLPGTVQLTPSGKLIVLMRDCQTTGGYPRVLQLKESAINTLSQKFTGNDIGFKSLD